MNFFSYNRKYFPKISKNPYVGAISTWGEIFFSRLWPRAAPPKMVISLWNFCQLTFHYLSTCTRSFRRFRSKINGVPSQGFRGTPPIYGPPPLGGNFFFQLFLPLTSCHHSKNGDILVKPFDSSAPTIRAHAQEVSWDFDQNVVGLPVKVFWGTPQIYQPPPLGGFPVLMHSIEKSCFFGASG